MVKNNTLNIIYILRNTFNEKVYIGQTWKSLKRRWRNGIGYKGCAHLDNAIKKYGKDKFYYKVLTVCGTQEIANYWEAYFIKKYNSNNKEYGYNIKNGGSNGKHSAESIKKMSDVKIGKIHTQESKEKVSRSLLGNKRGIGNKNRLGSRHSDITRNKMSEALKGRAAPNKGKPISEVQKQKLSAVLQGRIAHNKGKSCSEEQKQKISIANKGRKSSKRKFSGQIELNIIELSKNGLSSYQIADKYNCNPSTINRLLKRNKDIL